MSDNSGRGGKVQGMKKFLVASLITLTIAFSLEAQEHTKTPRVAPPDGWVTFNSEPGRFSVLMPELPTDKTDTVQSDHGPYTTHLFIVKGGKSVYLIGWVDYNPGFKFNSHSELDANRDNFIKGINATLVNSRAVTVDGYQCLEFTAETSETTYKSRVYIVGRRPYQLVAGTVKGLEDSDNVTKFFDSFKVRLPQ